MDSKIKKCCFEILIKIFEKKEWSAICEGCGCPINKKIFSKEINPCPMGYWIESDKNNGGNTETKNKKSTFFFHFPLKTNATTRLSSNTTMNEN